MENRVILVTKVNPILCLCSYSLQIQSSKMSRDERETAQNRERHKAQWGESSGILGAVNHLWWDKSRDSWQPNKKWHHVFLSPNRVAHSSSLPLLFLWISNADTQRRSHISHLIWKHISCSNTVSNFRTLVTCHCLLEGNGCLIPPQLALLALTMDNVQNQTWNNHFGHRLNNS